MNREELLAKKYLESLSQTSIVYEPDGNTPPDFLLDNCVAVEVTRLNKHIEVQGILKRTDDDRPSISAFIETALHGFDSNLQNVSFGVTIHIKRPLGNRKKVRSNLLKLLSSFESGEAVKARQKYYVSDGLSVRFIEVKYDLDKPVFNLMGISDHDNVGWVHQEVARNVGYCIENKSSKIEPFKSKYKEWWLILVDSIAYGSYSESIDDFKATFEKGGFDKVIVLEAINGHYVFDI